MAINSHKIYAMLMEFIKNPIFKGGAVNVAISGGVYTFAIDTASVFDASVTADGTVTFTCNDPTKCFQFQINATTTGAYNFTSFSMSGVTIYRKSSAAITLKATGRTTLGCTYDGPGATLDIFDVQMAAA